MVRYAGWRESVDPERPLERYDRAIRIGLSATASLALGSCCFVLAPFAGYYEWRGLGNRDLERRVRRLRDEPARYPQFACRLTLMRDGTIYGRDEGLLSFAEGHLLFEGRATSFSGPRADAGPGLIQEKSFGFRFGPSPKPYQSLLKGTEDFEASLVYRTWLEEPEASVAVIVFPPVVPDDERRKAPDLLRRAAFLLCSVAILTGVGLAYVDTLIAGLGIFILAMSPSLFLWSQARRLRHTLAEMREFA